MTRPGLQMQVMEHIVALKQSGNHVIVVHGGGPFIQEELNRHQIQSEFVGGHRVTPPESLAVVEKALKGTVNGQLVSACNQLGCKALGLSGKDGQLVLAQKRMPADAAHKSVDLGAVGDVKSVNTSLLLSLLDLDLIPVIACLATDEQGRDYNVNADMMAGFIAGALQAEHLLVLTDVDGLRSNPQDPHSLLSHVSVAEVQAMFGNAIQGGMIPKMEACIMALNMGAKKVVVLNGTQPKSLTEVLHNNKNYGTTIQ